MRLRVLAAAFGAAAAIGLAGCSTSTSAPNITPTEAPETASPAASPTDVLPPVEVDGTKPALEVTIGETLNVTSDGVTSVSTDNTEVLQVSQPRTDGSAEFDAGAEVVGAGTATLTVKGAGGDLYTVTISATE